MAALPGIIGSITSWISEQSKRSRRLVISEFVGTYNRCWSFDIQVFYDENEMKINHSNVHHTVKIDVIPDIKAAFSST